MKGKEEGVESREIDGNRISFFSNNTMSLLHEKFVVNFLPMAAKSRDVYRVFPGFFRRILVYVALGGAVPLFFCGDDCFATVSDSIQSILFGTIMSFALWEGNGWLSWWLDNRLPWLEKPYQRFGWGLLATVFYTVTAVLVLYMGYFYFLTGGRPWDAPWMAGTVISSIVITAIISLFLHSRAFLLGWREASLRAERLAREQLHSQYLSLKNQLQPHFLFNSLSALSSLVHQNPDLATRFIHQLSGMYRYILSYSEDSLVPLDQELTFLRSYLFLMQIRFGDNLRIDIDLPALDGYMVAPLTLQLLAENAFKHNEVSQANPLSLRIYFAPDGHHVVVSNPIQPRTMPAESTGVGLSNIRKRYLLLSGRQVSIHQSNGRFEVFIPLIPTESAQTLPAHEDSDGGR